MLFYRLKSYSLRYYLVLKPLFEILLGLEQVSKSCISLIICFQEQISLIRKLQSLQDHYIKLKIYEYFFCRYFFLEKAKW
jgi:hypothetical protein